MLQRLQFGHPIDEINPVVSAQELIACQDAIRAVHVDDKIRQYILDIVQGTRTHDDIQLGGSPRASIALFRTGQAFAAISGRDFVLPDDVKRMVQPVLAHRIIIRPESRLRKVTAANLLHEIVDEVRVPIHPRQEEEMEDHFSR
jgi:MoxR-like ATPase